MYFSNKSCTVCLKTFFKFRFAEDFFNAPEVYKYGMAITRLFVKWEQNDYKDVREGVDELFRGTGSMGNGGGMRVSPAALFAISFNQEHFNVSVVVFF